LYGILPWNEQNEEASKEKSGESSDNVFNALNNSEYSTGGHVDNFSVEALLHILRS